MYLLFSILMFLFLTSGSTASAAESGEILYEVRMENPLSHLFQIRMSFSTPDPDGAKLAMPAWTPGYYDITDPVRNLQEMEAEDESGRKVGMEKLDKQTWRIAAAGNSNLTVRYKVYANRLTVDGAQLNDSHGYFNGAALFLYLVGHKKNPCRLKIVVPEGWKIATALRSSGAPGQFVAADYDELVDSPLEAGQFRELEFSVKGAPYRVVAHGQANQETFPEDVRKIVAATQDLMGEIPFRRFTMFFHFLPTGAAGKGLEHADSFSIIAGSQLLRDGESYRGKFLPIVAHEFFHAWNVKWIRPKELAPYDYSREQYTKLLWAAEGFTTYYSALILKRAGLITEKEYLKWLSDRIGSLERSWGRVFRSAEEASWDAWIPGENPRSRLSYYIKGCLLGLLLDLEIRHSTLDRKSLDDVVRLLGERFAKKNEGFTTEELEALVKETGGDSLSGFFDDYVRGVKELPLSNALSHAGLLLSRKPPKKDSPSLDVSLGDASGFPEIREIPPGSPAGQGELDSGDVIIAVEGRRVTLSTLPEILSDYRIGDRVRVSFFRREELRETMVTLGGNQSREFEITPVESPGQLEKKIYCSWLREKHFPVPREKKEERNLLEKP